MDCSAGPSRTQTPSDIPLPLPRDDPGAAEHAREHLAPKRRFPSISHFRLKRKNKRGAGRREHKEQHFPDFLSDLESPGADSGIVKLNDKLLQESASGQNADTPIYRWAVLYENQRGATIFSTPYYSSQTLLPLDPPPHTLYTSKPSRRAWRAQPDVSLASYPLPDGTWRWVSRAWMIDMRGDGQVQHDGFEYAWSFRAKQWHPEVGALSAGGWVRRRRWVRLMVRCKISDMVHLDAERVEKAEEEESEDMAEAMGLGIELMHHEEGMTRPPSVMLTAHDADEGLHVWQGDDGDWDRCHAALRRLGRDGRKLELWKRWFGFGSHSDNQPSIEHGEDEKLASEDENNKGKAKASEYEVPSSATSGKEIASGAGVEAPREYIANVIQYHGSEIFRSFVYPDSRAQFLEILDAAGLLNELRSSIGYSDSVDVLDFWSYAHGDKLHQQSPFVDQRDPSDVGIGAAGTEMDGST
ncbi:hypothetical protein WOLCODRAFT_160226 [Wolfiporia cocos MD-104 SS10]|uniref:Peroxin/Ferlin domain-containing protein n=1 Tax=Wolfiporia cocos (strain MD-104) TaxID=742152 RepID=A0A2H3IUI0_WOLCO|nr:hypothetical protein WOLCODRAFT_160226 [Wolfiporia cocos MD-104 SS10]